LVVGLNLEAPVDQPHLTNIQWAKHTPSTRPPTPELKPTFKKLRTESAICIALKSHGDGKSVGLMKWFMKATPEECQAREKRVDAMINEGLNEYEAMKSMETKHNK
jgi:hypothetical protein